MLVLVCQKSAQHKAGVDWSVIVGTSEFQFVSNIEITTHNNIGIVISITEYLIEGEVHPKANTALNIAF